MANVGKGILSPGGTVSASPGWPGGAGFRELSAPPGSEFECGLEALGSIMAQAGPAVVSDLDFSSSNPPYARIMGVWRRAAEGIIPVGELARFLDQIARNESASSMAMGGTSLDFGCEHGRGREDRVRFRGNATAMADGWSTGLSVILRVLPGAPPRLESLGLEPELAEALAPPNGLVVVAGVMGSGKSTLLASVFRRVS